MMGRFKGCALVGLLVFYLGASVLTAEARNHQSFSASTYYEGAEKVVTTSKNTAKEPNVTNPMDTDPNNRYPDGYPGQEHVYNKVTEKYDDVVPKSVSKTETTLPNENTTSTETPVKPTGTIPDPTDTDPNNRYPDGYPGQEHVYNKVTEKYDDVVPKSVSKTETTLPNENTTSTETPVKPTGTIPDRYPAGYTNGHGTYQGGTYQQQYMGETKTDEFTYDPVEGRYKAGYYPDSTYAGAQKTVVKTNGGEVSLASQNQTQTAPGNFQNRYEKGYYPSSQYTQQGYKQTLQGPKQVTYSSNNGPYNGNFNTMPYPNSGVPFVASGGGCRTAYWIQNVASWPAFLKVTSTVGEAFGAQATATYGGIDLLQALLKFSPDPYSQLLKSGTTALLNSYTRGAYGLSHMKVIEEFNAALVSKEAATAQALAFETENVQSISAGSACT